MNNADDLRAQGWAVAVHNDYRINGLPHTFWLLTKGDRCIKGEGLTDAAALNEIRSALPTPQPQPQPRPMEQVAYPKPPKGSPWLLCAAMIMVGFILSEMLTIIAKHCR